MSIAVSGSKSTFGKINSPISTSSGGASMVAGLPVLSIVSCETRGVCLIEISTGSKLTTETNGKPSGSSEYMLATVPRGDIGKTTDSAPQASSSSRQKRSRFGIVVSGTTCGIATSPSPCHVILMPFRMGRIPSLSLKRAMKLSMSKVSRSNAVMSIRPKVDMPAEKTIMCRSIPVTPCNARSASLNAAKRSISGWAAFVASLLMKFSIPVVRSLTILPKVKSLRAFSSKDTGLPSASVISTCLGEPSATMTDTSPP
jgi:hypothetical protein